MHVAVDSSVLNEAADRDGSGVAGCRQALGESNADVDQRRAAKAIYVGDGRPDRPSDFAVWLRPWLAAGDADAVEDADILMLGKAGQPVGRRDDSRVDAQQAFDHSLVAGLLGHFPDHRVERILSVLNPAAGECPVGLALCWKVTGEQHPAVFDAHGVRRQPETHPRTVTQCPDAVIVNGWRYAAEARTNVVSATGMLPLLGPDQVR